MGARAAQALAFCAICLVAGASAASSKRGFVADGGASGLTCRDPDLLSGTSWFYGYNPASPYAGCSHEYRQRFYPMFWCLKSLHQEVPKNVSTATIMTFNEPNNEHNCNTPAKDVAQAFGEIMKRFPHSELVSPATAGNGVPWFDEFFAECHKLYGSNCGLKYLAVHDYSCDADHLHEYLEEVHSRYGLPVWLTEFACGDHSALRPLSDQMTFMRKAIPMLEKSESVARYAWMSARQKEGDHRQLLETASNGTAVLTELGRLYNSL